MSIRMRNTFKQGRKYVYFYITNIDHPTYISERVTYSFVCSVYLSIEEREKDILSCQLIDRDCWVNCWKVQMQQLIATLNNK